MPEEGAEMVQKSGRDKNRSEMRVPCPRYLKNKWEPLEGTTGVSNRARELQIAHHRAFYPPPLTIYLGNSLLQAALWQCRRAGVTHFYCHSQIYNELALALIPAGGSSYKLLPQYFMYNGLRAPKNLSRYFILHYPNQYLLRSPV